ncbi:MAG TPA: outer membrane lipid asymmetry maintenance protein MlaD [Candidatus Binataceae bacterium]|nr:outer membrane lipid asymmetry maintenance protein MlaD [Candidatus Binataceae bacterium]
MYASRTTQFLVGIFALIGLAALAYLSLRLGRVEIFNPPSYEIFANFDNITGLKTGDAVEIAGVAVGKVFSISLLDDRAHVGMQIDQGVKVDDDAIAAIRTRGIIGDKYVALSLGPGDKMLTNGQTLRQTESAFVLEDVIGQLINSFSSGGSGKSSSGGSKSQGSGGSFPSLNDPGSK